MIPYVGGKSKISKWVVGNFPENYQKLSYIEVFGGAGWVILRKEPSSCEVYNDRNDHLVALWEAMRDEGEEFERRSGWTLHSRSMFGKALIALKGASDRDDIDHALQFAIAQTMSFSGTGKTYGYARSGKPSWNAFCRRIERVRDIGYCWRCDR